jgi:hypothetical protein
MTTSEGLLRETEAGQGTGRDRSLANVCAH